MGFESKIEWTDHTFSPWVGCTKISPACDHCYAEGWAKRSGQVVWGGERKRTSVANWRLPVKWDKHAALMQSAWAQGVALHGGDESACIAAGFIKPVRPKVFCASLADVFDNAVPTHWRLVLFELIADTPNLDWLILTKRIGNVMSMCSGDSLMFEMIGQRVWLGATIVNQTEADRDIPKLLAVPAHKRFLSMEPLLGTVDLTKWIGQQPAIGATTYRDDKDIYRCDLTGTPVDGIDWVIVGGESGPNARPMHPDWARSLRDQCEAAGVPFLFKQWGEWKPICEGGSDWCDALYKSRRKAKEGEDQAVLDDIYGKACAVEYGAVHRDGSLHGILEPMAFIVGAMSTYKVGKKAAGRLLDGREWNGVPEVPGFNTVCPERLDGAA